MASHIGRLATAVCLGVVAVTANSVVSANDVIAMVIKGPDIAGNMVSPLPGAIEVLSVKGAVKSQPNTGAGTAIAMLQDLSIIKRLDRSSIVLFQGAASGTHYTSVSLLFYHVNQGVASQFYQIDLGGVVTISSDAFGDTEAQPLANDLETVTFHSCTIMLTSFTPAPAQLGYDFCQGVKL